MSREELIAENKALKTNHESVNFQLDQLQKIVFGAKRERFVPQTADNQLNMFSEPDSEKEPEQESTEKISRTRKKKKKHPGRNAFPDHLPVEEETIEPEEDVSYMVHIGDEISETVEYTPASLFVRRTIRPKYAPKQGEGEIKIASLPSKPIDKGIAGSSLLAWLLVSKFVDHTA